MYDSAHKNVRNKNQNGIRIGRELPIPEGCTWLEGMQERF
jgi:hypothetical protein